MKSLSEKVKLLPSHDLQGLLNVLAETHRDWFPAGFGRLEVTGETHYFAKIKGDVLHLSDAESLVPGFRPASDLRQALAAIQQQTPLTFNQEYDVELLWHEALHFQAEKIEQGGLLVETLTQFMARHTYPKLLKAIGADPLHARAIVEKGYGYPLAANPSESDRQCDLALDAARDAGFSRTGVRTAQ